MVVSSGHSGRTGRTGESRYNLQVVMLHVCCNASTLPLPSSLLLQLVASITSDPAIVKKLMAKRQVYECASHYPLDMLVPVGDDAITGYKLKWIALPHPGGIPPAPVLGAAAKAALRPVVVLRAAAAAMSTDPRMPAVLSASAKLMVQNADLQRQLRFKMQLPCDFD